MRAAIVGGFRDWAGEPAFPARVRGGPRIARRAVPIDLLGSRGTPERGGAEQPAFALARIAAGAPTMR